MQFINTNSPLRPDQLAALYAKGDPNLSSQAAGWVNGQAANMGISGGVGNYFTQQRANAANTAAAVQGRQMELARLAGADLSPDAQRNAQIDAAVAQQAAQQAHLATLQRSSALANTALPTSLNPMAADPNNYLERTGVTPAQRAFSSRLGGVSEGRQFVGNNTTALDVEELSNDPRFMALMNQAPDKASHVFAALTGGDLSTHVKTQAARLKDNDRFGMDTVQDWFKSQRATFDKDSNSWKMRKLIPDPMNPDRLIVGAGYDDPDPFQAELLKKYGPQVAPLITEGQRLAAKKAADMAAEAARHPNMGSQGSVAEADPLKKYSNSPLGYAVGEGLHSAANAAVDYLNPDQFGVAHPDQILPEAVDDFKTDVFGHTVGNAGIGLWNLMGGSVPYVDPVQAHRPDGPTPAHARQSAIIRTPAFQQLLRRDPNSARRIIQSIQQGGGL